MDKVRYGIIGCRMGRSHMAGLRENKLAELVAICDIDTEALDACKELYPDARTYTDYKAHPSIYLEPYPTWLESLKIDIILYSLVILICIIVISVLKITLKKRSKMIET